MAAGKSPRKKIRRYGEPFHLTRFDNPGGTISWRVTGMLGGKQVRENFRTHAEALTRKDELMLRRADTQASVMRRATRLTDDQLQEAETAWQNLARGGRSSLLHAVSFYLANYRDSDRQATIREAFERMIEAKRKENLRVESIKSLKARNAELLRLHGHKLVHEITLDALRPLIQKASWSAASQNNTRRDMHTFFEWAKAENYAPRNPVNDLKRVRAPSHDMGAVEFMNVAECSRLLTAAAGYKDGKLLPYTALALFAGLRPDKELGRLSWNEIDFITEIDPMTQREKIRGQIRVTARVAKKRSRRVMDMTENLVNWLLPYSVAKPAIKPPNWRKDFDAIKRLAKFGNGDGLKPWVVDYTRHTAITYHLAASDNEGKTATWAGNSPDVIRRHYKGLSSKKEAETFWDITPSILEGKLVLVNFPKETSRHPR